MQQARTGWRSRRQYRIYRIDTALLALSGAQFSATVTNAAGSIASAAAALTVVAIPPYIAAQPAPQSVLDGAPVTFLVAATGSDPFSFQWQRNGVDIPGATNALYTLLSVSAVDDGAIFTARVTNAVGTVDSDPVLLNVTTTPVAPGISTQPQSITAASGSTPTGTAPFGYQWKRNGVAIAGAYSAAYLLAPINILNDATYSVTVTNSVGSIDSQVVQITATATALDLYAGAPGGSGNLDGPLLAARFSAPKIFSTDTAGNIYVVDGTGLLLRKISASGNVTTLFPVPYARVAGPDSGGNFFVAGDCSIAKLSPSGVSSPFAGSPGTNGTLCGGMVAFGNPAGIMAKQMLLAEDGNLYLNENNCTVRKVTPAGNVWALGGSGVFATAVAIDAAGDVLVADVSHHAILKIDATNTVTTVAGNGFFNGTNDGNGTAAGFNSPSGIAIAPTAAST